MRNILRPCALLFLSFLLVGTVLTASSSVLVAAGPSAGTDIIPPPSATATKTTSPETIDDMLKTKMPSTQGPIKVPRPATGSFNGTDTDAASLYEFVFPSSFHRHVERYLANFSGADTVPILSAWSMLPVVLAVCYVAFVFLGQAVMADRAPLNVRSFVIFWNFLLASFSIIGAVITVPFVIQAVAEKGLVGAMCTDPREPGYFYSGTVGVFMFAFILSKIPELVDTILLVLQKKPVIFLHWYHHFTVMLFCWHSWVTAVPTGIFFGTMNYAVHAVMYSYYFFMCFNATRKWVRPMAIFITAAQILQMVVGIALSVGAFSLMNDYTEEECPLDPTNVKLGLGMYISYMLLFSALFKKLYFGPNARGAKKKKVN